MTKTSKRSPSFSPSVTSEEIYSAPALLRDTAATDHDEVTVTTLRRKPKVYLTAPSTVAQVDLPRFMGRWYEIARLPYFTQRRCVGNVSADYRLAANGDVHVTNRCRHADGRYGEAKGLARVVDTVSNARLQISFRMLYGVHVFWDDYWIIGLGSDYEYALIGQPTRRRGWIIAREPQPAADDLAQWRDEFNHKGFSAKDLIWTRQDAATTPQI